MTARAEWPLSGAHQLRPFRCSGVGLVLLALVVVDLGCGDEVEGLRVAVAGAEAVNRCCQLRNHLEADRQGVMSVTACEQAVDAGCLVDVDRVGDVVKELRGDVPRFVVGENAHALRLLVGCATTPGSEDAPFGRAAKGPRHWNYAPRVRCSSWAQSGLR